MTTSTTSPLSEAEVIRDLLEELLVVRQQLRAAEADTRAYREMVSIQTAQLSEALSRIKQQSETLVRLREEMRSKAVTA